MQKKEPNSFSVVGCMQWNKSAIARQLCFAKNNHPILYIIVANSILIYHAQSLQLINESSTTHEKQIDSFCSHSLDSIFCSASQDKVVLWNYSSFPSFQIISSQMLASHFGHVHSMMFSNSKLWNGIAFCVDDAIVLFDLDRQLSIMQLEGHQSSVLQVAFFQQNNELFLISISEDNTFKIWNIFDKKCIYSSNWIDQCALQWMVQLNSNQFFILSKKKLFQFEVKIKSHMKEIGKFDLQQLIQKWKQKQKSVEKVTEFVIVNSEPIWKQQSRYLEQIFSTPVIKEEEEEKAIIGMEFVSFSSTRQTQQQCLTWGILFIGFTDCILLINTSNMDIIDLLQLDFHMVYFTTRIEEKSILVYCSNAFDPSIRIISISLDQLQNKLNSLLKEEEQQFLSIFATESLKQSLQQEIQSTKECTLLKKKKSDKPIVFHTTIKSSGYTSSPFMRKKPIKPVSPSTKINNAVSSTDTYNLNALPPSKLDEKCVSKEMGSLFKFPNSICKLKMSYDGKYFAIGCSDYLLKSSKFPISLKNDNHCISYQLHQSAIHHVSWSYSNKYLLSSSSDGKSVLWQQNEKDPLITFQNKVKNYGKNMNQTDLFVGETCANFFHVDQLICITNSNKLYLYKYHIQELNLDQQILNKESTPHKYKQVGVYETTDQYFCAQQCINSFYSHLLFLATSNKNIELVDANRNKPMRIIKDAHTRPIHTISLYESSQYVPFDYYFQMNETHNSPFLTSSLDGSIKMWDLRSDKCVRKFSGHVANSSKIGCSFSPCMRFIATGSEDKCVYLYDVKHGTILHKINAKCTDTISDVQFHPKTGQLITSSYDGSIRIFA